MNIKKMISALLLLAVGTTATLFAQTAVTVGNQVTSEADMQEGVPYLIFQPRNSTYVKEASDRYSAFASNLSDDTGVFYFVKVSDGVYKIKSHSTGKFISKPTTDGIAAIAPVEEASAGEWNLQFDSNGCIYPLCNGYGWDRGNNALWATAGAPTTYNESGNVKLYKIYEVALSSTAPFSDFTDKDIVVSTAEAASLATATWYVMRNRGRNGYLYEYTSSHSLYNQASAPTGSATDNANFLVRLVTGDDGKFYLQNGLGNYFGVIPQNTSVPMTALHEELLTVNKINNTDGHFYLQGASNNIVLDCQENGHPVVGWGTSIPTSTGGNNDWAFYPVEFVESWVPTVSEVYTINNTNANRGALIYNPDASTKYVWSSGRSGTFNATQANSQWVIIPSETAKQYYLYNVGAGKFAIPSGTASTASWIFSADAVAVTFITQGDGTKKIKTVTTDTYAAVSNGYDGPIINYNDVGGNFTITKVDDADSSTVATAAVNKLIANQSALTAAPTGDGWYAIRVKSHSTYSDQYIYTFNTEVSYNGTSYPLGFYSAVHIQPSITDALYFVKLTKSTYGHYCQMPNGLYIQGASKPISGTGESSIAISFDATNHFTIKSGNYFWQPYYLSSNYFIGETSSSGTTYYDIYPIDLSTAGLVAWQVLCDGASDVTKIACTRSDVSGLASVYKNGYIFLPTGVTPASTDFTLEGATSVAVDADAKTVSFEYDPDLSILAEGVTVTQGYQTTGRGNENALLLRIDATAFASMTSATLTVSLKDETKDNISSLYLYESDALEFIANIPNTKLATTTDFSTGTATLSLGDVTTGTHHYWLCATVKSDAALGTILDAAVTNIGYTSTSDSPKAMSCDLTAVGDPSKQGAKVFALQNFVFKPTAEDCRYYRIPSMMLDKNGNVVVAIDKRYNSNSDLGNHKIDVYSKRSENGGATWQDVALIAAGDGSTAAAYGYGDAGMVRAANGDLVCVMAAGSKRWGSDASNGMMYAGVAKSSDNGKTWTLTPNIFSTSNFYDEVHSTQGSLGFSNLFTTAGKGLTTNDGILMFTTNCTEMGTTSPALLYILYSTDNGTTWRLSNALAYSGCDESKLEQLNDGSLLVSVRQSGNRGWNKATYTKNGDGTVTFNWGTQYRTSDITGNACNADIINYGREAGIGDDVLIHSYINSSARESLQLAMSLDGGNSWKDIYNIQPNGSCYSTMQVLADGTLAILFEDESYSAGNGYAINYVTITKEQIEAWHEALVDQLYPTDASQVKNTVTGSSTGCDTWGSLSDAASGRWSRTWTSNASSGVAGLTITSNGYGFDKANVYSQRVMTLRPSSDGATDIITITAPSGFVIDSYTITGCNYSSSQTYQMWVDENNKITTSTTGGTLTVNGINATSTSFSFYGSSSSTNYLCITNFIITLKTAKEVPLNVVGDASYATLYLPYAISLPENTKAYTVTGIENDYAQLTEIPDVVPATTPVILINSASEASVLCAMTNETTSYSGPNFLHGTLFNRLLDLSNDSPYYSLGRKDGNIGFYKFSSAGKTTITLGANKAFLEVPQSVGVKGFTFNFGGIVDGIDSLERQPSDRVIYDLAGRRIAKPARGLYIVNGKKVAIK